MSVLLERAAQKETVLAEARAGDVDGQGAPSYLDAVSIKAHVTREDSQTVSNEGSAERTSLTLRVPGGEDLLPEEGDRVTYEGVAYIVVERREGKTLRTASIDHVRLKCKREGAE